VNLIEGALLAANRDGRNVTVRWLGTHGIRIAVILAVALGVSLIAAAAVRRVRRRMEASQDSASADSITRAVTITNILTGTVRIIVWTLAILLILGEIGVNLAPLLAGAGIAGVALGFGAQNMVRDFLAGFYILFEDQFGVGDIVELSVTGGIITGRVEALTLRTSAVRGNDGVYYVVANGNIQYTANLSRGHGRIAIDVAIPDPSSAESVQQILTTLLDEVRAEPPFAGLFLRSPTVAGRPSDDDGVLLEVVAETNPARRAQLEDELRRRIARRFRDEPYRVAVDLPD
jgi:small-conductance mechanosensitive channel